MKQIGWSHDMGAIVAQLRNFAPARAEVTAAVGAIIDDVRARGDEAVQELTARLDGVVLANEYGVPAAHLRRMLDGLEPALRQALELAAVNVRAYHQREAPAAWREVLAQGQTVGQEIVPLAVAGLYVPGGLANYPSSVLMTVIPAQVAGVARVVVCSPPRRSDGDDPSGPGDGEAGSAGPTGSAGPAVARGVAAVCALLGVTDVFPIGGAQAVAAMAFGTAAVPRCDVIVGPGNAYVTEAKRQVMGQVGIDGLAGPSEVLVIADETADPLWVAADLLAQAEHGAGAMACLADIGGSRGAPVAAALAALAADLGVSHDNVAVVSCPSRAAAVELCNAFGPEHLELHTADARELVPLVRNAGAIFVGSFAATAFADYAAGSNHVLPTGGSARFAQGLSVADFQKRVAVVEIDRAAAAALAPHVAAIAEEEGLRAHARSALLRAKQGAPQ
jgi:histidinol dehydrogenase